MGGWVEGAVGRLGGGQNMRVSGVCAGVRAALACILPVGAKLSALCLLFLVFWAAVRARLGLEA